MLKGFWTKNKGASLGFKINQLKLEFKYAWQRAWKGYDTTDIFNFDLNFIDRTILILKDFKKHSPKLFLDEDEYNSYIINSVKYCFGKKKTDEIIDEMIYYFENSDADKLFELMYGTPNESTLSIEQIESVYKTAENNRKKALELFVKYFDYLWY